MTFAALWDLWRTPAEPNGTLFKSFAIITTQANDLLRPLHRRMPVVLAPQSWAAWLGETPATAREPKAMLQQYSVRAMVFWSVDRKVGNMRNSLDLFTPLRQEPLGAVALRGRSQARKNAKPSPKPWQLRRMPPTYIV
jgi:putative SOS response-associated peptidase YedK